jgi:hypothetical protein
VLSGSLFEIDILELSHNYESIEILTKLDVMQSAKSTQPVTINVERNQHNVNRCSMLGLAN